jgi:hypothetical protein
MSRLPSPSGRSFLFAATTIVVGSLAAPGAGAAQLIPIKTVPVAAGNQFMIFPSDNPGLGGVSIALHDRSLDGFLNPAKGAHLSGGFVSGSPGFYDISGDNGGARTLPVSAAGRGDRWFGGGAAAFQELDVGRSDDFRFDLEGSPLSRSSATNLYVSGFGGLRATDTGLSLGVGAFWADLDGLDGVKLLYTPGATIDQTGHMLDVRVGLFQAWEDGGSGEAVLVHNRFEMTHRIAQQFWWGVPELVDPVMPPIDPLPRPQPPPPRVERDETNTWGVHLGYERPVGTAGWHLGGILTGNWKSHPKIPNYDIMNIPRDPGNSWAYNLGLGVAHTSGPTTFGADVIYEPIWSDTWVEAETPVRTARGRTIAVGERTLENDFRFDNWVLRTGVGRQEARWGAQLGLQVRSYSYELDQMDLIAGTFRQQDESWLEWTPTWAVMARFDDLRVQYAGSLNSGAGRPGAGVSDVTLAGAEGFDSGTTFLAAPRGPLSLQEARVVTHRLTVVVPLG